MSIRVVYIANPCTGEVFIEAKDIKIESVEPDDKTYVNQRFNFKPLNSGEVSFDVQINRNQLLSLLTGKDITNNWLKMHGGIMTRRNKKVKAEVKK